MADQTSEAFKLLAEVQAALKAGDLNTLRRSAEALKGSITSLLANRAFEAASTLERTLCEDDLARAQDACRRLREALSRLNESAAERSGPIETPK
jgi:HPt (histidine-containing phosphotransfer) domain-containing protein